MPPREPAEAGKLAWLDALRGWAILLVLLTHTGQGEFGLRALDSYAPRIPWLDLSPALANIVVRAGLGVQLFFVVSAFSLTRSTVARAGRGEPVGLAFLIRRVARVGPAFWLAALGYTAVFGFGPRLFAPHGITGVDIGLTVVMLHVWWPSALNSVVPGGWSVGCEMMFYLLLPAVLGVANRTGRMMALLPAGLMLAQLGWWAAGGPVPNSFGFIAQLPAFYLGILACRAAHTPGSGWIRRLPRRMVAAAAVLVFITMVAALPQPWMFPLPTEGTLGFVVLAAVLCLLLDAAPARLLVNRVMVEIGRVSYSMYLVHFILLAPGFAATRWIVGQPVDRGVSGGAGFLLIYFSLVAAGAFLAASVTYRLVEQPGMALGRRLIRRYRLAEGAPRPMSVPILTLPDAGLSMEERR